MLVLTQLATVLCQHKLGAVSIVPTQDVVSVEQKFVLIEPNPESRPIAGCPMYGALIKPCTQTYEVKKGYSSLMRIDGKRICLDNVTGLTNGTPPGSVPYNVAFAGQVFVSERE